MSKTGKWWALGILVLSCCFSAVGSSSELPAIAHRIHSMAHRGCPKVAPENTLPGFRLAIATGVDSCEFDVYATKDGVLVLSHDENLTRRSGGKCTAKITELTWEEVRQMDVSDGFDAYAGTTVPSLDEVLDLFHGSGCIPVLEIKQEGIEERVAATLKAHNMVQECAIVSFRHASIQKMRDLCPGIYAYRNGGNRKGRSSAEFVQWFVESQKDCPYRVANPSYKEFDSSTIQALKKEGFLVSTWIINDAATMRKYLDWGVDTITTDYPEVLVQVLKERAANK